MAITSAKKILLLEVRLLRQDVRNLPMRPSVWLVRTLFPWTSTTGCLVKMRASFIHISKKARPSWRLNFASCPGFSLDIYYPVKTPTTICIWRRPEDRTYSYESSGRCSIFRLNFLMFLVWRGIRILTKATKQLFLSTSELKNQSKHENMHLGTCALSCICWW